MIRQAVKILKLPLSRTFVSLKYPNFRLWFFGQMLSLFGTWMQTTAIGYYGFTLTNSEAFLGYMGFAAGVPTIVLMLFGGVAADYIPRRNLIIMAQTLMMVMAFLLSVLTFLNMIRPWHLIVIAVANGIANAFDAPARQAFVLEMVEREVLTNAIALNSGMFNIATAIGPALGGIAYAFFGPAWCFIINAVSFLAVITALLLMKLPPVMRNTREISPLIEMRDGIQYVMKAPFIQIMILIVTFSTLLGFSLFTLLPAWAVTILHGDARTNGFLQSFRGLGALSAAFFIAFLGNTKFRLRLLKIGIIAFPCFMMIFSIITVRPLSFITVRPLSFFIIFLAGSGLMFIYNLANAFVQSTVKDEFRGRVMSIYALTFFGTLPLGSLAAGALADSIGSALVVFGSSVILLIFAVVVLRFSKGIQLAKENREGAL